MLRCPCVKMGAHGMVVWHAVLVIVDVHVREERPYDFPNIVFVFLGRNGSWLWLNGTD